ncbi:MAG TPA: CHAD domain-containing protein [Candidatus Baltobacteraceae bacterium]|jgi:CHAD domain-containing protein|nr:CHAD domain-containing protein [Candidatus Baltobacteraceae bacterium]
MNKRGRTPDLFAADSPQSAIRSLLRLRFAECLEQQHVLSSQDDDAIHAFRLACKRLRYAIERWPQELPQLQPAAQLLSEVTDELGNAHDCAIIADRAQACNANVVGRMVQSDSRRYVARAIVRWRAGFRAQGAFAPLAAFTAYQWSLNGAR